MKKKTTSTASTSSDIQDELVDLTDYIRRIERRERDTKKVYFYRGHGTVGHTLTPSLFRALANRKHEKNILRELVSIHPSEFSSDRGVFEQLVRMQHFSLPTRLLDVTTNPLVALYFCCVTNPKLPGEVIRVIAKAEHVKYYDSDTVSCVANLSNLSGRERDQLRRITSDAALSESDAGKRLLQFIKSEKPYFNPQIKRQDLDAPLVVKPRLSNRRLLAQQGAFLLFGLKSSLPDNNGHGLTITKIPVSVKAKSKITSSLDKIGINASTLFPEIESAARYIISSVTPEIDDEVGI